METHNSNDPKHGVSVNRIEALTDGIFAIAMTLLVLSVDLPQKGKELTDIGLHRVLAGQYKEFFNYALSFFLLANFWVIHHKQFNFIRHTDNKHLWINILTLFFISLVPFSTSLVGDFSQDAIAELFFAANIFCIAILLRWNWTYAVDKHRLVDPNLNSEYIIIVRRRSMVLPIVAFLAMVVSLLHPSSASYTFLLIPCLMKFTYFRKVTN